LQGTTWVTGQMHLLVLGAGLLGGLAALWWWAPKLWGVQLPEGAGMLAFLGAFGGSLLLAVPQLINGLVNDLSMRSPEFTDDAVAVLTGVSAAGAVLLALTGLLVALVLLGAARKRDAVADDPWGGNTLEWATSSPPPAENFTAP